LSNRCHPERRGALFVPRSRRICSCSCLCFCFCSCSCFSCCHSRRESAVREICHSTKIAWPGLDFQAGETTKPTRLCFCLCSCYSSCHSRRESARVPQNLARSMRNSRSRRRPRSRLRNPRPLMQLDSRGQALRASPPTPCQFSYPACPMRTRLMTLILRTSRDAGVKPGALWNNPISVVNSNECIRPVLAGRCVVADTGEMRRRKCCRQLT